MEHAACQATDSESKSGLASSSPFGLFQGRTLARPEASAFKRSNSEVGDGEYATKGQQGASNEVDYNHVPPDRVGFITEDSGRRLIKSAEVKHCLQKNWESGLHRGIRKLLRSLWTLFADSRVSGGLNLPRTEVLHHQFIRVLDQWLEAFHETEQEFSNCPFTYQ
jgi:hypothetical protein